MVHSLRSFINQWRCTVVNNSNNVNNNSLLEQIRALSFVKTELELYLDTHPNCRTALDYYQQTINALDSLREEYHNTHGPLFADGVVSTDNWTWVDTPWPWQHGAGAPNNTRGV